MFKSTISRQLFVVGLIFFGLSACGEVPQSAGMQSGKYQGKADTRPWEGSAQVFSGSDFKRGDQESWSKALANRAQSQNEYTRTK